MDRNARGATARILLVDDVELNCMLTGAILRSHGYEVASANDGASALLALEKQSFDLVLLDIEMPGLSGHEVAALIQQRERSATRMAALSFVRDPSVRLRSFELGLRAHIARPIKPDDLLREIETLLRDTDAPSDDDPCRREGL